MRHAPMARSHIPVTFPGMRDSSISDRGLARGLSILGLALVIAAAVTAWGLAQLRSAGDELTVTGSSRRAVTSDLVVWRLTVSATRPGLADAQRDVNAQGARGRAFGRAQHVPDSAVTESPLTTVTVNETRNGNETGRVAACRLTQGFVVTRRSAAAITGVVGHVSELVTQGVPVDSDRPEYLATQLPELRVGVFQVTRPNSTDVSDDGTYDTSSREKDVTAVVRVTFALP